MRRHPENLHVGMDVPRHGGRGGSRAVRTTKMLGRRIHGFRNRKPTGARPPHSAAPGAGVGPQNPGVIWSKSGVRGRVYYSIATESAPTCTKSSENAHMSEPGRALGARIKSQAAAHPRTPRNGLEFSWSNERFGRKIPKIVQKLPQGGAQRTPDPSTANLGRSVQVLGGWYKPPPPHRLPMWAPPFTSKHRMPHLPQPAGSRCFFRVFWEPVTRELAPPSKWRTYIIT